MAGTNATPYGIRDSAGLGSSTPNNSFIQFVHDYTDDINSYYYEGDVELLRKPWTEEPYFVPTLAVYGMAFVIGIMGNLLVIFAMLGDRKSQSVTSSFLVSLAFADILFLLVCVPFESARYFIVHWSIGTELCKLSGFVEMLSAVASIVNLTAVSVERYIVIVHPMRSRRLCTRGNTVKILSVVWIIAAASSFPMFFVQDVEKTRYYNNVTSVIVFFCGDVGIPESHRLGFAIYQLLIMLVVPTVVMVFCYAQVIGVLWISAKQLIHMTVPSSTNSVPAHTDSSNIALTSSERPLHHKSKLRSIVRRFDSEQNREIREARKQVIKMLITIILVFLLCWGPMVVFKVMRRQNLAIMYFQAAFTAKIVLVCLPYVQSCLNPIIYGFMSRNFRKSMRIACRAYILPKARMYHNRAISRRNSDQCMESRTNGLFHAYWGQSGSGRHSTKISSIYEDGETIA